MDQLKDFMKQAVKYRFWIALGLSALLPLIGYLVGAGPIQKNADEATKKIEASSKDVQNYTQANIPNRQYVPIVKAKTDIVTKDVSKAWEKLYAVQAPLLKWPEEVEERFHTWGRKWPENVDKGAVQQVISEYINIYPAAVDSTYAMVKPWDPIEGTGVVVVPDKTMFLQPAVFDEANPPELGQIWAAQERLWIQGTLLSAVAKINGNAKTWDTAIVKQISEMMVGLPEAQDQKSTAKGQTVEVSPSLTPGGEATTTDSSTSTTGKAPGSTVEEVYHIKTDSQQYTIMPVKLVALVDQNRLQEYLIGLENSPMSIQVMEFELSKPMVAVTKPVKGEMVGGMMNNMMGSGGGYGGMESMMRAYQNSGKSSGGMSGYPMGGMNSGYPGGGMMGAATKSKSGTDVRSKDAKKDRLAKEQARRERARATDMYYDIVEVTVYGQARFYNPPPAAPAAEPSASESAPADPAKPATDDSAVKTADPKTADPKATDAKATDPATPTDATKATEPVGKPADATKATETTKPADTTKATEPEGKPADATKATTPVVKPVQATKATEPVVKPADATPSGSPDKPADPTKPTAPKN